MYQDNNDNIKFFLIDYKLFIILMLCMPLYLFNNIYIKQIGSISIITILLLPILDTISRRDEIKIDKSFLFNHLSLWFILFLCYSTLMLIRKPTIKALYSYLLQVVLLFFISKFNTISLDQQVIKEISKWSKILCFIILIPSSIIILEGGNVAFFKFNDYFNPVIYKVMLPCSFFFVINTKYKFLTIFLFSTIHFAMGERTSAIVLIIIYVVYLILNKIKNSKILYRSIFIGVVLVTIGFVFAYVQLQYSEIGDIINEIFVEYTGGRFFSGRNRIWEVTFNFIKEAPILGHGIDNGLLHSAGINQSTHNTYLYILLQGGIVGLFIFIAFMYSIWERYFNFLDNEIVVTAAAYLIGILVFINFELTMLRNTVVTAIFMWLILGIGLAECNNIEN